MIGRTFLPLFRNTASQSARQAMIHRSFYSTRLMSTATPSEVLPVARPIGALRGGQV